MNESIRVHTSESYIYTIINHSDSYIWKLYLYHLQSMNEKIRVHTYHSPINTIINHSDSYIWNLYLYHHQSIIQSINENIRVHAYHSPIIPSSINPIHTSESYIYTIFNQSFNQSMKIFAFKHLKAISIPSSINQIHISESYIYTNINQWKYSRSYILYSY